MEEEQTTSEQTTTEETEFDSEQTIETQTVEQTDYSEQLDTIIELLEKIETMVDYVNAGMSSITTYAVVYIPLFFITLMLWWLFRQFIERYR